MGLKPLVNNLFLRHKRAGYKRLILQDRQDGREKSQSKALHSGKSCAKMRIFSAIFCRILQTVVFFLQFSANFCSFLHPLARLIEEFMLFF